MSNGASNASISDVSGNHLNATPLNLVSSTNLSVSNAADLVAGVVIEISEEWDTGKVCLRPRTKKLQRN